MEIKRKKYGSVEGGLYMELKKREIDILQDKLYNPNKKVLCPKCGAELLYEEYPSASRVLCPREVDVEIVARGI